MLLDMYEQCQYRTYIISKRKKEFDEGKHPRHANTQTKIIVT